MNEPPAKLDASIIFAAAGELVPVALKAIRNSGTIVLGGIHMSAIPSLDYSLIYGERVVPQRRQQHVRPRAASFSWKLPASLFTLINKNALFEQANEALIPWKNDSIRGEGVLVIN